MQKLDSASTVSAVRSEVNTFMKIMGDGNSVELATYWNNKNKDYRRIKFHKEIKDNVATQLVELIEKKFKFPAGVTRRSGYSGELVYVWFNIPLYALESAEAA